jgi:recombination DNA repair RAD52 pathway protein
MERAVVGNNYESRMLMYRNVDPLEDIMNKELAVNSEGNDFVDDDEDAQEANDDEDDLELKESSEETENQSAENEGSDSFLTIGKLNL